MIIPNQTNVTYNAVILGEGATLGKLASNTVNVEGSVFIDGTSLPDYRPDVGYNVANPTPDGSTTIGFKVTVD